MTDKVFIYPDGAASGHFVWNNVKKCYQVKTATGDWCDIMPKVEEVTVSRFMDDVGQEDYYCHRYRCPNCKGTELIDTFKFCALLISGLKKAVLRDGANGTRRKNYSKKNSQFL